MPADVQPRPSHAAAWRIARWSAAAALLAVPLLAMQFTDEVDWTAGDFLFAAILIGGVGFLFEVALRLSRSGVYRAAAAVALAAGFVLTWANAAVGIIGDEGPANLMFVGVVAIPVVGGFVTRFRADGMMRVLLVTAAAQAAASTSGFFLGDPRGATLAFFFCGLWLLSAGLFRAAAADAARTA